MAETQQAAVREIEALRRALSEKEVEAARLLAAKEEEAARMMAAKEEEAA